MPMPEVFREAIAALRRIVDEADEESAQRLTFEALQVVKGIRRSLADLEALNEDLERCFTLIGSYGVTVHQNVRHGELGRSPIAVSKTGAHDAINGLEVLLAHAPLRQD